MQPRSHNLDSRNVLHVSSVHFGRDVSDVFLDVPDTFARSTLMPKKDDVIGVCLRIICTHNAEQSGFPCTVLPTQCPVFPIHHREVQVLQNGSLSIFDIHILEVNHMLRTRLRISIRFGIQR